MPRGFRRHGVVIPNDGVLHGVRERQQHDEVKRIQLRQFPLTEEAQQDNQYQVNDHRAQKFLHDRQVLWKHAFKHRCEHHASEHTTSPSSAKLNQLHDRINDVVRRGPERSSSSIEIPCDRIPLRNRGPVPVSGACIEDCSPALIGGNSVATASNPVFVELAPFRIQPQFVGRDWGWDDLHPWYDKVASKEPIGEVWLTGDDCEIATGPHAKKTLAAIFEELPRAILGRDEDSGSPLLIKVIFAREKLSVQVHPDDRLAWKYGQPRGKTECWYALAAGSDAQVAVGLRRGVTIQEVKAGIDRGTLEQSLNMLPVHAGDMIFVDAGTVHAIWPGSVLLETQQNSDVTYRMYDYGRGREIGR